jgi:peptide deformylase
VAVLQVVSLPAPVLRGRAREVGEIDDAVRQLCADLVETMRASPACVGLAAPQVGVDLRVFCVDVTGHRKARSCHGAFVLVDPEVVTAARPEVAREGCMSVPDLTGDVPRATELVVRGRSPEGEERVLTVDAFEARAVQHELDHLDGLLFLDRVAAGRVFPRKVYR